MPTTSTTNPDPLLSTDASEQYTGTSKYTLAYLRQKHEGPVYIKRGRRIFYRKSALDEWLRSLEIDPTTAA